MNDREGMHLRKFLPKRGTCGDSFFKTSETRTEWLSSGELESASRESASLFGAREAYLRRIGHNGAAKRQQCLGEADSESALAARLWNSKSERVALDQKRLQILFLVKCI